MHCFGETWYCTSSNDIFYGTIITDIIHTNHHINLRRLTIKDWNVLHVVGPILSVLANNLHYSHRQFCYLPHTLMVVHSWNILSLYIKHTQVGFTPQMFSDLFLTLYTIFWQMYNQFNIIFASHIAVCVVADTCMLSSMCILYQYILDYIYIIWIFYIPVSSKKL